MFICGLFGFCGTAKINTSMICLHSFFPVQLCRFLLFALFSCTTFVVCSIMTADVHRKLFSSDKDVSAMRSAVSVLTDAVKHHPDDVIDSLDLLLKWLSLQFFSTFEEEIANVVFQYALLLFVMLADKVSGRREQIMKKRSRDE